jgi:hypothetical protein
MAGGERPLANNLTVIISATMANRAFPQRVTGELLVAIPVVLVWLGLGRAWVGRSHAEELAAMLQLFFAVSIAQEPCPWS